MSISNYFELKTSKRYFHLIAVQSEKNFTADNFWDQCGVEQDKKNQKMHSGDNYTIIQKRILSNIPFYNGLTDYSINGDDKPPYNYDMFSIELQNQNILIIGFPFKGLAVNVISRLIETYNFLNKVEFLKCDLSKLIKSNSVHISNSEQFTSFFSGVNLKLTGDTHVTKVGLDGDRPLESTLYKDFFKERIQKDECLLDKCTVKCELIEPTLKTKSNVHIDNFGNYKLYVHGSGKNIFTIPYLFEALKDHNCLLTTITNPIPFISESNLNEK